MSEVMQKTHKEKRKFSTESPFSGFGSAHPWRHGGTSMILGTCRAALLWVVLFSVCLSVPVTAEGSLDRNFRFSAETTADLRIEFFGIVDSLSLDSKAKADCLNWIFADLKTAFMHVHDVDFSALRYPDEFVQKVHGLTLPELVEFARETRKQYHELVLRGMTESAAMLDSMIRRARDPMKREQWAERREAVLEQIDNYREKFHEELKLFDCFEGIEDA